jgi:hypothetical protein
MEDFPLSVCEPLLNGMFVVCSLYSKGRGTCLSEEEANLGNLSTASVSSFETDRPGAFPIGWQTEGERCVQQEMGNPCCSIRVLSLRQFGVVAERDQGADGALTSRREPPFGSTKFL